MSPETLSSHKKLIELEGKSDLDSGIDIAYINGVIKSDF